MTRIKLQSGEVFAGAVQGFTGNVPCKIWSAHGNSLALLEKILKRNASKSAAFVAGPYIMGLNERLERGGRHSPKTKRRIAEASRRQRGRGKQDRQYNVPQSLQAKAAMAPRRGGQKPARKRNG